MRPPKRRGRRTANATMLANSFVKRLSKGQFVNRTRQPFSNLRLTALPEALKKWTKQP